MNGVGGGGQRPSLRRNGSRRRGGILTRPSAPPPPPGVHTACRPVYTLIRRANTHVALPPLSSMSGPGDGGLVHSGPNPPQRPKNRLGFLVSQTRPVTFLRPRPARTLPSRLGGSCWHPLLPGLWRFLSWVSQGRACSAGGWGKGGFQSFQGCFCPPLISG